MLLDLNHSSHEIDLWTGRAGLTKNGAISDGRKRIKVSRQPGGQRSGQNGSCKDYWLASSESIFSRIRPMAGWQIGSWAGYSIMVYVQQSAGRTRSADFI